jgi:hypothetical protein
MLIVATCSYPYMLNFYLEIFFIISNVYCDLRRAMLFPKTWSFKRQTSCTMFTMLLKCSIPYNMWLSWNIILYIFVCYREIHHCRLHSSFKTIQVFLSRRKCIWKLWSIPANDSGFQWSRAFVQSTLSSLHSNVSFLMSTFSHKIQRACL